MEHHQDCGSEDWQVRSIVVQVRSIVEQHDTERSRQGDRIFERPSWNADNIVPVHEVQKIADYVHEPESVECVSGRCCALPKFDGPLAEAAQIEGVVRNLVC